jgi:hypothetical protein
MLSVEKQQKALHSLANTLCPEAWNDDMFEHTYEGPDDMPAHVKSALFGVSPCLPLFSNNNNDNSQQQQLYAIEARDCGGWGGGHNRKVVRTVVAGRARLEVKVVLGGQKSVSQLDAKLLQLTPEQQVLLQTSTVCHLQVQTPQVGVYLGPVGTSWPLQGLAQMVTSSLAPAVGGGSTGQFVQTAQLVHPQQQAVFLCTYGLKPPTQITLTVTVF